MRASQAGLAGNLAAELAADLANRREDTNLGEAADEPG
jgi:hypothetical protein